MNVFLYNTARWIYKTFFPEERIPFDKANSEELFPGLYDREITLSNMTWKWGDLANEKQLIFLCALAKAGYSPILEIGTFRGRTTYNLALNSTGPVTTVDIGGSLGRTFDAAANVETHKYDEYTTGEVFLNGSPAIKSRITQIIGDSTKVDFSAMYGKMGMVIVDGGHSYEGCKADSEQALKMLKPQGVIVWDDYGWYWPGVKKSIDELSTSTKLHFLNREGMVVHVAGKPLGGPGAPASA
jgi:predicted O-methyltransferase YrrM